MRALKKKVKAAWGWVLALLEAPRYYFAIIKIEWYKKPPFLPLTTKRYVKFRLDTAYGMKENGWKRPPMGKLIVDTKNFLLWRREMRLGMKRRRSKGWTLIEIMIVVAFIGILIAIFAPKMDNVFVEEDDRYRDDVRCSWWTGNDLCLCEVGSRGQKWGFIGPPEACTK